MEKDNIEDLFGKLQDQFDVEEPLTGHQERFLTKLNKSNQTVTFTKPRYNWWKPLSIAASLALLVALIYGQMDFNPSLNEQMAEISPEVANTQFYFTNLIETQVKELEAEESPETQKIISDTMDQLKDLEQDFKMLENELLEGGNGKLILSAMITNFQTRIDLLNDVLNQIETIKNLKNYDDAKYTI